MSSCPVLLARHGECFDAVAYPDSHPLPDSPLTELGRDQAAALASELRGHIARVMSSPLRRAIDTAEIVAGALGVRDVTVLDSLAEWRPPTRVLRVPRKDLPIEYQAWQRRRFEDPAASFEDGESLLGLHERTRGVRDLLLREGRDAGPILVVGHKMCLSVIMHHAEGAVVAFKSGMGLNWSNTEVRLLQQSDAR